jgi:hypothetical protein
MNGSRARSPVLEFEVVGVAVGAAFVSGALALLDGDLTSLTGALAALAFAGWVAHRAGDPSGRTRPFRERDGVVVGFLALGAVVFLAGPGVLQRFRALFLATTLLPLWLTARGAAPRNR